MSSHRIGLCLGALLVVAIAASMCGSPIVYAKAPASRPAKSPTISPRTRSDPKVRMRLVAGRAEQVAAVVHQLVQVHTRLRHGTLVEGDQIAEQKHQTDAEQRHGEQTG